MNPEIDHVAEANRILAARAKGATLTPISERARIAMDDAYAIQSHVVAAWHERGERRIGWKLGYTSAAMRAQMGVAQPNYGPLTDAMLVLDGSDVTGRFTQPRVEPEIAFRFGRDVAPGADRTMVMEAVESAHASLEIVDSVWDDYRFTIEDNTADGSSAAGFVIGRTIPLDRVAEVQVVLALDKEEFARGVGSDASGHPADGVVWLVAELAAVGEVVRAGDFVITGGLTGAPYLRDGTLIEATFSLGQGLTDVVTSVRHRPTN